MSAFNIRDIVSIRGEEEGRGAEIVHSFYSSSSVPFYGKNIPPSFEGSAL